MNLNHGCAMPVRFLKPGSIVWFHSDKCREPVMGTVIRVWNQREANIIVMIDNKLITMYSVRIVYLGDPLPRWGYCYATMENPFEPPLLKG